jgi:ubiquinone/menaquinone biosynthesis C-methylase UbiE
MNWTDTHKRFQGNDSGRRQWQNPEAILQSLELTKGNTFIDIGCGEGFFALPAADIVGSDGKVYGVDIDPAATDILRNKAGREGLDNIIITTGPAEEVVFCNACADLIFFGIDLHDLRDPGKALDNARIMVKPHGRLADLDWKKEETPFGPPLHIRFSEEDASSLISSAGFIVESIVYPGPYHYLILARPHPP